MSQIGIEKLNVYTGLTAIDVAELFCARGLDANRLENIQQKRRSIGLGFEDPVTSAVNAAHPIVEALGDDARRIENLIISTESGVDFSKSVGSYVHEYLKLSRNCRVFEVKQACYAATGALQLAMGYTASGVSPGSKTLMIATDVALVDARAEYAEPSMGFGAAAVLVGRKPEVLRLDPGAFGIYSYEVMDSARPIPSADIVNVDRSLFAYLDCLSNSLNDYLSRVPEADFCTTFGQICMHTPFVGLVKAAHRKLMREHGGRPESIEPDFVERLSASLVYPQLVGNLCSGSLYLALASLIDNRTGDDPARVGLYSFGSGCSSEFFSGVIDAGSRAALRPFDLGSSLARRTTLSFEQYEELLDSNLRIIVPAENREIRIEDYEHLLPQQRPRILALRRIRGFHRNYEWIRDTPWTTDSTCYALLPRTSPRSCPTWTPRP